MFVLGEERESDDRPRDKGYCDEKKRICKAEVPFFFLYFMSGEEERKSFIDEESKRQEEEPPHTRVF